MADLLSNFNAKTQRVSDLLNKFKAKEQSPAMVDWNDLVDALKVHPSGGYSNKNEDVELPSGWRKDDVPATTPLSDIYYWQKWFNDPRFRKFPMDTQVVEGGKVTQPMKFLTLPDWVRTFPGFTPTAWIVSEGVNGTRAELVTYDKSEPNDGGEPPFAMIMFTKNGVPFKQMDNMYKELSTSIEGVVAEHGAKVIKNYEMSKDGKIRNSDGDGLPNRVITMTAIRDLALFYAIWRKFPDTEEYKLVELLSEALTKVVSMREEDDNQMIRKQIEKYRDKIHLCQESIAKLEKEENKIYEDAADAMNLLEKHGYGMEKVDEIVSSEMKPIEKLAPDDKYVLAP